MSASAVPCRTLLCHRSFGRTVVCQMIVAAFVASLAASCAAERPGRGGVAHPAASSRLPELGSATLRRGVRTASVSAFWNVDRQYLDAPTLKPHSAVTIAELEGPGAILLLRISAIPAIAKANLLRGIVLEIAFDGAPEPAVLCPLPDFFCDGLNGKSAEFASRYVEKVPYAWNAYFPMPFRKSAKVTFRNDTDVDTCCYAYLEWQTLPAWDPDLGYFHATYSRSGFELTHETRQEFLRVKGRGHLLGRQLSIATDEPSFRGFGFVMEGNNEVDVDGDRRRLDYLGSEDSFTFSWGFNKIFTTPHAGITHLQMGGPAQRLSIYRFHDAMPIRFEREVAWTIDWKNEDVNFGKQSGWVDYAAVFYWYQDEPGGFRHAPLGPVAERCLDHLPAPEKVPDLRGALEKLDADPRLDNDFSTRADLDRVAILQAYPGTHPFWIDEPVPKGGHPGQPNPGRRGILAVHAEGIQAPCYVIRKVALPAIRVRSGRRPTGPSRGVAGRDPPDTGPSAAR